MILRLCVNNKDPQGMNISYVFEDCSTGKACAIATDNYKESVKLIVDDKEYNFFNHPKFIDKVNINTKYPVSSKRKKTIGFHILSEGKSCCYFYGEAITCKKIGLLKRNIGFTVFAFNEQPYLLYRVGFPKQESHYYCLHDNNGETIAIIERHCSGTSDCKATIYIENKDYVLITILACTEEIICVANSGNHDDMIDTSAGNYISVLEEERDMYDSSFIERIKLGGRL